jgi:hypothetical protein
LLAIGSSPCWRSRRDLRKPIDSGLLDSPTACGPTSLHGQ